jgi:hypothetical protein
VSIPQDRLPADDQRFLVVPVVATLPVVFVDQFGPDEDPRRNRYGETFYLRRLLNPMTGGEQADRRFVEVRHVTIEQLNRELIQDARLVVIAGVSGPAGTVPLLRQYVEQGGNLVIAAGGFFDPALWTEEAWLDGLGVLPAPLDAITVGRLPDEAPGPVEPFQLDFETLVHDDFLLEATSREELQDLYRLPYFFKTAAAKVDDEVQQTMVRTVAKSVEERRKALGEIDGRLAELDAREDLGGGARRQWEDLRRQRAALQPDWLLWNSPREKSNAQESAAEVAERARPRVMACYTNGLPFMVRREVGRGQVLLVTSSVSPDWNTLPLTNTVLIYDRILRGMLQDTLPRRNIGSHEQLVVPVRPAERTARFALVHPDGSRQPLMVEAVAVDRFGVRVGQLTERGNYRVVATRSRDDPRGTLEARLWEVPVAINGPAEESQLLSQVEIQRRHERGQAKSVETTEAAAVGLQRASLYGQDLWKWLMAAVLLGLLVELVILAWFGRRGERTG